MQFSVFHPVLTIPCQWHWLATLKCNVYTTLATLTNARPQVCVCVFTESLFAQMAPYIIKWSCGFSCVHDLCKCVCVCVHVAVHFVTDVGSCMFAVRVKVWNITVLLQTACSPAQLRSNCCLYGLNLGDKVTSSIIFFFPALLYHSGYTTHLSAQQCKVITTSVLLRTT